MIGRGRHRVDSDGSVVESRILRRSNRLGDDNVAVRSGMSGKRLPEDVAVGVGHVPVRYFPAFLGKELKILAAPAVNLR